ncbi:hypothetical protein [Saccharopolyspora sp. NPDC050642]|uniref:hypothetical protein n=1 Tax=Saccharopolyspora sp. NPDC050642 TaxID=3157099 RepID=UPI0033DB2347
MPSYFEVFFGSSSQGSIVDTIEHIIGLKLDPTEEEYADFIGVRDSGTEHFVSFELLLNHRLDYEADEDTGIPFNQMPSSLTVRGPRGDEEEHKQITQDVFLKLKNGGCKPIYFVYDVDQVIQFWDPDKKGDPEVMEFWEPDQEDDHDTDA